MPTSICPLLVLVQNLPRVIPRTIVGRVLLATNQKLRVVKVTPVSSSDLVNRLAKRSAKSHEEQEESNTQKGQDPQR